MDSYPTTPEQRSEVKKGSENVDSVILQCPATQLKVHPHGLSAKKQVKESASHENSTSSNDAAMGRSLDCVKRSDNFPETAEGTKLINDSSALNQRNMKEFANADSNRKKAFHEQSTMLLMNHSPIKIELSSPAKREEFEDNLDDEVPAKKLKLETVPNLALFDQYQYEAPLSSPEAIEMIDTKSSPMKELDDKLVEEERKHPIAGYHEAVRRNSDSGGNLATPTFDEKSENTLSLPKLTPLFHEENIESTSKEVLEYSPHKMDSGNVCEEFKAINERNRELVEEVYTLNKKLNGVTANWDLAFHEFKNLKLYVKTSSFAYENRIKSLLEDIKAISSERDKFEVGLGKLKQKIGESRDEISMLNQNQAILQKKYETVMTEADRWKRLSNEMEESFIEMRDLAVEHKEKAQSLEADLKTLTDKFTSYQSESSRRELLYNEENDKNRILQGELFKKGEELVRLEKQLQESIACQKNVSDKVTVEVAELMSIKSELEGQLASLHKESTEELSALKKLLNDKQSELDSALENLNKERKICLDLKEQVHEKSRQLASKQKEYEELNDDAEIRKAEIVELNAMIKELRESKSAFETSVYELEGKLKGCEDRLKEEQRVSQSENEYLKSSNIEAEHLAELENLHSNLTSLQDSLKQNSQLISELQSENMKLKNNQRISEENTIEKKSQEKLISALRSEINDWKDKYMNKEQESNKSLKLLAEDLYIQYSSKHEQKVKLLKKGYETKYQGKLEKLNLQNEGLTQEIEELKSRLDSERKERQSLLDILDKIKAEKE